MKLLIAVAPDEHAGISVQPDNSFLLVLTIPQTRTLHKQLQEKLDEAANNAHLQSEIDKGYY